MKILIGATLSLAASAGLTADAYKWVDEKGVTNYGEKAPDSRPARAVNTSPSGIVEGGGQFAQKSGAEPYAVAPPPPPFGSSPPAPGAIATRGMDFDVFIRLQRGMSEGELLLRAGPPDFQSVDGFGYGVVKSYYYYPTVANPYTTLVTLRGGRIAGLERIKKF